MTPTIERHELGFELLSDSSTAAAQAFGLAFKVDDGTVSRYKGFGIDLEDASGEKHHVLPVPAVYVCDTSGKILFEYVNPDYRIRLPSSVLLAAAKELKE